MPARRVVLASLIVLAFVGGFGVPRAGAAQPPIGRWFGAEGGWMEHSCLALGASCPGFLTVSTFGGSVGAVETHTEHQDADLVERVWPARTGNRLFMADVPGGAPSVAYLSTTGSDLGPFRSGTLSFSFRAHTLPLQPVVIYRHTGSIPAETPVVTLSLSPEGRVVLSAAGSVPAASRPLAPMAWHTVTITYAPSPGRTVRLYVDDQAPVGGTLTLPSPTGNVDLGIVSATSAPFTIGIDDVVESPAFDARIRGARINYLMPMGQGAVAWTKRYPVEACNDAAANWQLVSEDQHVRATGSDGETVSCNLGGSAVGTDENGVVDRYLTEGIRSGHRPSASYHRDLAAQPHASDAILGVRVRARGLTDGPPVPISVGYLDKGAPTSDDLTFDGGGSGGSQMRWGPTHTARTGGEEWTAGALGALSLRLDSGSGFPGLAVRRSIFAVRLDYVWVP